VRSQWGANIVRSSLIHHGGYHSQGVGLLVRLVQDRLWHLITLFWHFLFSLFSSGMGSEEIDLKQKKGKTTTHKRGRW
jgi:hypothetical protein